MATSVGQAIRNAVEAERGSYRFYTFIAENTTDAEARKFLKEMAEQEKMHAEAVENLGKKLAGGQLPVSADDNVEVVETAPGWKFVEDISMAEALAIAREAEQSAILYYETLADCFPEPLKDFFAQIAKSEEDHLKTIEEKLGRL
jgi:rubrerythrin